MSRTTALLGACALLPSLSAGARGVSLGVSVNMGNVLEAPIEGNWAPPAQEYYFDDYKTAGFQSVRVPVRWDNHTMREAPYTVNATFMARVAQVVNWSLSRGLNTIINSHHDDWLDDVAAFDAMLPRFQAIWTQVAQQFASAPPSLLFECFNEPHIMTVAQLNTMFSTFYTTVRASNPTRFLLFGGLQWDGPAWIAQNPTAMVIPGLGQDPAVGVEIHDYDPHPFTMSPISITSWGTAADVQAVFYTMGNMTAWSQKNHNIPIFLGEFGCTVQQNNTLARTKWYQTFTAAVKAQDDAFMGYAIWYATPRAQSLLHARVRGTCTPRSRAAYRDDDGWFKTYDRANRVWDETVLKAIGL